MTFSPIQKDEPELVTLRVADSGVQAGNGHPGHLEGGAEMMWELNAELAKALRQCAAQIAHQDALNAEVEAELERLRRPRFCPECGWSSAA